MNAEPIIMTLPDGRILVSAPDGMAGAVIMDVRVVLPSRDMNLLILGRRPPGAGPSNITVTVADSRRLRGVRDARRVPAWDLPVVASCHVALPEGSWAVAKPGDLAPYDDVDVYVFGIQRCGNHGVIRWLLGQFPHVDLENFDGIFLNCCYGLDDVKQPKKDRVRLISYENKPDILNASFRDSLMAVEPGRYKHCFLILRSPLNWYSSFLKRFGKPSNWMLDLFLRYFEDFYLNSVDPRIVPILYDRWFVDPLYRKMIGLRLVRQPSDRGFGKMFDCLLWRSSFDGKKYKDNATEMKVLDRYKELPPDVIDQLRKNPRIDRINRYLEGPGDANG